MWSSVYRRECLPKNLKGCDDGVGFSDMRTWKDIAVEYCEVGSIGFASEHRDDFVGHVSVFVKIKY
jgi:hypothetical protein